MKKIPLLYNLMEKSWILISILAFNLLQQVFLLEEYKEKLALYKNDVGKN